MRLDKKLTGGKHTFDGAVLQLGVGGNYHEDSSEKRGMKEEKAAFEAPGICRC